MTAPLAEQVQRALGETYRVDRELGGGGMSRVFVARDLTLDRDVVVKVLNDEQTAGVSADRFRREIQLIARLQHPHVVSILSAGTAGSSLYYVMPFVTGETLRERITREGPLPIADAVRLLREVLDALAFAHDHGVVHRDIKPENVLIGAGHAVVADFGIAKALKESGNMTSAGFALGTPTYMAPEQATADPTTDHRADLYAVGVLGYELLTGAPPFAGSTQQMITAHLTTPPTPIGARRADVPDAVADTIMRALAKDPADRPQTAREMMTALESVTTPSSTRFRTTPAKTRRRAAIAAGAGSVLVLAAAGLYAARSRMNATPASSVTAGADLIAVMPLSAVSDSSLARLGQDLVVTLSTNLDGVGTLQTVDAVTLLMQTRKAASPLALAEARTLARGLGARSVLTGTLIREGSRVRASVTLHQVGSDSVIAKASALAAPGDIAAITDSLTWGVLQQIWRRGTPPSRVLSGVTTRSVDALRAFLDGERHFQRLNGQAALADYRRAFEIDSNFVQAYLRHHFVSSWHLAPEDSAVDARLSLLKDRLPERERLWLETSEEQLPLPMKIPKWKALAARYPDYPPILMAAADPIIHSGPEYGIPISDARPYLDRLETLLPEHGDTRFHVALVHLVTGSADSIGASLSSASRLMEPPFGPMLTLTGKLYQAHARGTPPPPVDSLFPVARELAAGGLSATPFYLLGGLLGFDAHYAQYRLDALDRIRAAGIYPSAFELASTLGEGMLRIARGDWTGGLRALHRTEGSALPFAERMTSARLACLGAWLGAVDLAAADSTLRRVRALPGSDITLTDRVELQWLDGLLGVMLGDETRVQRARREVLADTSVSARYAARSLAGLWLARTNAEGGADTLKAVTDLAMREGGSVMSVEAVDRLLVARALRRRGAPADAERYLMWTDGSTSVVRNMTVKLALSPLESYERGAALDEAGKHTVAAFQLRRFLSEYDQPPPPHRGLADDAKKRLARLEATDVPRKTVTPR